MSFWDFLTHEEPKIEIVNKEERARGTRNLNVYLNGIISGTSNDRFSEEEVLSIPVANACLAIIVNSIKDLPIELYQRVSDKETKKITDDYRLKLLNDTPNLVSTGIDFKARMIRDIVLHGNAYIEIERNGNNIESLWNLDADKVAIRVLNDTDKPYIVKDIMIDYVGSRVSLGIDDVMIAVTDSDDLGLSGNGVIAYGSEVIELALNEIELSKNIMSNGSSPSSVLTVQKQLSPDAQQRLRDSWERMYKGSNNSGKLIILEEGMEYQKISYSPTELEMTSSMSNTSTFICQLFNVPEQLLSADKNSYGSVESMSIRFLQYCISPILSVMESAFNRHLLLEKEKKEYFFKFSTDGILQTTQQERYQALSLGISSGILSLNEARFRENLPPIEDNFHRLSLGSVMYDPDNRVYYIPNMSTVIDANTKKIISSPDMVKEGLQDQNQQESQIDKKENTTNKKEENKEVIDSEKQ